MNERSQSNAISTTKYTMLTWLPLSLWNQFQRVANVYFLVISILMLIGKYAPMIFQTPLDPYSTIVTFVFVLIAFLIRLVTERPEVRQGSNPHPHRNPYPATAPRALRTKGRVNL